MQITMMQQQSHLPNPASCNFSKLKCSMKGAHSNDVEHINSTTAFPKRTSRPYWSSGQDSGEICTSNWDTFDGTKTVCNFFNHKIVTQIQFSSATTHTFIFPIQLHMQVFTLMVKGKAVPLQAWSGLEGSRKLGFPDSMTTAQDGCKVVSLTHRPPIPPGNTPGTHFC